MRFILLSFVVCLFISTKLFSQNLQFSRQQNSDYWGLGSYRIDSSISFGRNLWSNAIVDFNNDGLKDIIIPSYLNNGFNLQFLRFFKNNGKGKFVDISDQINNGKKHIIYQNDYKPTIFDFNKDGKNDFFYGGILENEETKDYDKNYGLQKLKDYYYANVAPESFEFKAVQGFSGLNLFLQENGNIIKTNSVFDKKTFGRFYSSNSTDINNDGYEDLLINAEGYVVEDSTIKDWFNGIIIWKNNNGKNLTYNHLSFDDTASKYLFATTGINTENNEISFGDYNNDGFKDIMIFGYKTKYRPTEKNLKPFIDSSMWAPFYKYYDRLNPIPETRIYFNINGNFKSDNYIVIPNVKATVSREIDINMDGKNDFIGQWINQRAGNSYYLDSNSNRDNINTRYYVSINKGNGQFEDQTALYFKNENYTFSRLSNSGFSLIDLDNDGYKDIIPITGIMDSLYNTFGVYSQDTAGSLATIYYKNINNTSFKKIIIDSFFVVKEWSNYPILKNLDSMFLNRYNNNTSNKPIVKGQYLQEQLYLLNQIYIDDFNNDKYNDILGFKSYDNDIENFLRSRYNFTYNTSRIGKSLSLIINCKIEKPIFNTTKFSFCSGDSLKLSITNINKGDTIKWYFGSKSDLNNVANKIFTDTTKLFATRTDSLGCVKSSDTVNLVKLPLPSSPTISRDTANNLVANTNGITWFKDGTVIIDTTQRFKPSSPGSYTAKTTQNGCISSMSSPYYYLVTDIINLNKDEYIKLAPNPFQGQLNFDFVIKGYQRLNIDVYELSTGNRVKSIIGLTQGSKVDLGGLSSGTYVLRVSSLDNKISHQFKMVKL
jgi:hypothetical protein